MEMQFLVACREDRDGGALSDYVLATRRVFETRESAAEYATGISATREPVVIGGRFCELRHEVGGDADAPLLDHAADILRDRWQLSGSTDLRYEAHRARRGE